MHRCQRRAEFVADDGDEFALQPLDLLASGNIARDPDNPGYLALLVDQRGFGDRKPARLPVGCWVELDVVEEWLACGNDLLFFGKRAFRRGLRLKIQLSFADRLRRIVEEQNSGLGAVDANKS
jgi:hypothetical protein